MSTVETLQTVTTSSSATEQLAERLASNLRGGEVIELVSDLGGGKTTFVRGLARGLGSTDHVSSPTFTISNTYRTYSTVSHVDGVQGDKEKRTSRTSGTVSESRKQATQQSTTSASGVEGSALKQTGAVRELRHYDFYRLGQDAGLMQQELQEAMQDPDVVTVIEWGQAVSDLLPDDRLTVLLQVVSHDERKITISFPAEAKYLLEGVC